MYFLECIPNLTSSLPTPIFTMTTYDDLGLSLNTTVTQPKLNMRGVGTLFSHKSFCSAFMAASLYLFPWSLGAVRLSWTGSGLIGHGHKASSFTYVSVSE